jgi:hypothetical protein
MKRTIPLLLGLGVLLGSAAQAAPGLGEATIPNTPAMTQKADWDGWRYRRPWYRHHWHHPYWGYYRHPHWGYRRYGRW